MGGSERVKRLISLISSIKGKFTIWNFSFLLLGILLGHSILEKYSNSSKNTLKIYSVDRQREEINLISQLYDEKDQERLGELMETACKNINNPFITKIHFINTPSNLLFNLKKTCNYSEWELKVHSRVIQGDNYRLSVGRVLEYAREWLAGKTVIISNSDIYFDESLRYLRTERWLSPTNMYFLSRYESSNNEAEGIGTQCGPKYIGSHDSMIIVAPLPRVLVDRLKEVEVGMVGWENRVIYEARMFGMGVLNPCLTIKSWHNHVSRKMKQSTVQANSGNRSGIARPMSLLNRPPTLDELNQ